MIPQDLIKEAEEFAFKEAADFQTPAPLHLVVANEAGQKLAKALGANEDIVLLGTLLMDCKLGYARSIGKPLEHEELSRQAAEAIISKYTNIRPDEAANIYQCILQHHGGVQFFSRESEVTCNADCYRFLSIKGLVSGIKGFRDMPMSELMELFNQKLEEKWNALSLDICKQELEPQYRAIKEFLAQYKE